jgi:hypothetical protein
LRFEGKDKGTKRVVVELICDSHLEPIAVGSWESSPGSGGVASDDAVRT